METMIDNSLVTVDWQQITEKIDQLNQLKTKRDSTSELIAITNGLHSLLLRYSVESNSENLLTTSKRVAVVMPSVYNTASKITTIQNQEQSIMSEEVKEYGEPIVVNNIIDANKEEAELSTIEAPVLDSISKIKEMEKEVPSATQKIEEEVTSPESNTEILPEKDKEEKAEDVTPSIAQEETLPKESETPISQKTEEEKSKKQYSIWEAYSSNEIPTLTQQKTTDYKPSDSYPTVEDNSYNTATAGTPIKDLRKAISISDRYLFINELFRGEENEYERSIKTINNFNVYQEARYWIDRELKLKLGWDDKNNVVRQFNSLVQRRFA